MTKRFYFNGHTYEFITTATTWTAASANATAVGAHLAILSSASENAAVFSNAIANDSLLSNAPTAGDGGGAKYIWLGASDKVAEGVWRWVDDNSVSGYSNWGSGSFGAEPDNWGNQDAMAMGLQVWPQPSGGLGVPGQWNDVSESNYLYSVIEWDYLYGTSEDDNLIGTTDNNTLQGAAGNDTINGGGGIDTVVMSTKINNYSVNKTAAGYAIVHKYGSDGTDTLVNVEAIKFTDMTINLIVQAKAASAPPADVTRLVELYTAFFNRIPDADGMSFWIDEMKAGKTTNQVAEAFYNAGVNYSSLTGFSSTMKNADFINVIYKNVLGRKDGADAGGLSFWEGEITSGRATRGTLVTNILDSAHTFKGDKTWGWVADLLDNKITVAKKFSIDMGLNYNTPEESITKGMAIASAITPTDTSAAVTLIGVTEANFLLV
jgi:hypothetical protein